MQIKFTISLGDVIQVRAQTLKFQGCPISFFKASLSPTQYESTPGTVVEISENWFKIAALQGSINVGRVQLKGAPKIMADEFIKTNNLVIGDTFG